MRRGQVWIETVIYTLIGLSLIGLVLGFVSPKIAEYKDKAVIEQSLSSLNLLDSKINEVLQAPGNVRVVDLQLKRGSLYVDKINNQIYFQLDESRSAYSQQGEEVNVGRVKVLTTKGTKYNNVRLTINYGAQLQLGSEGDNPKKISAAATPYKIVMTHEGYKNNVDGTVTPIVGITVG